MSHSITSRRRTMRRRRRARRIGSPPVRRLARRVRRMSMRCAVAPALVAARAAQRGGELQARHQPVELGELVRLERVEALAGEPLLVARQRQRDARPRRSSGSSSPARGADDARPPPGSSWRARRRGRDRALGAGRSSSGLGVLGLGAAPPKTERKTASKAWTWDRSETKTERAVQYSRRRLSGRTSVSARAKPAERSGVTGTPAARRRWPSAPGERRQVEVDRLHTANVSHRCARAARGRPRGSPPGPRRTSAPTRA